MLVAIWNGIFKVVEYITDFILSAFPLSPFQFQIEVPTWASWVGALIPFREMAVFLTAYAGAVMLYYLIRTIARWVKLVGS